MRKSFAVLSGIAAAACMSLALAGPANATNETATVTSTMTPQSGPISKTERTPMNSTIEVEIKAPFPASPKVQPLKETLIHYPTDMTFNPDPDTPVCPDNLVGPTTNLSFPPDTIIARCPGSVIGNGTSDLYLAQANSAAGPNLNDPVLIIFNGGKNTEGNARIKIYGYSAGTAAGVYMDGVLEDNGDLRVKIPVLSFDSGTGRYDLNIPGSNVAEENRRGVDKNYVQAKCSTGVWHTSAEFTLGTRDTAGNPTSADYVAEAETTQECKGVVTEKGKYGSVKVKGPSSVKKGKKGSYKVTLKNSGKGSITSAKV
ncbi:MAG: hypothetical protein ACSLFI_00265, partial [Solirubrobacterales bacterium]